MKNIFITGSSGFVGKNILNTLSSSYNFIEFNRSNFEKITNCDIVIHLAGKAHDLKKTTSSKEYYDVNTDLTKSIFNHFLKSNSKTFIYFSSVKAVADEVESILTEEHSPNPITHYGKSKILAEQYILNKKSLNKKVFILRPCMIHGPGYKGNLINLYNFVKMGMPWPFGSFTNKRSFCSIGNLIFILNQLIENTDIDSGIYNIADDVPLSSTDLYKIIALSQNKYPIVIKIPKILILFVSYIGNIFNLPLNREKLNKITSNYIVSNKKISFAIKKSLPLSSYEGLVETFKINHKNAK